MHHELTRLSWPPPFGSDATACCRPLARPPTQMANNLEGGGKTPVMSPAALEDLGFKLCAYPLSLLGVSVRAMEGALEGLRHGQVPQPPAMPSFQVRAGARWVCWACWVLRRRGGRAAEGGRLEVDGQGLAWELHAE